MSQVNKLDFKLRQTYIEFITTVLMSSSILSLLDKVDLIGFHNLILKYLIFILENSFSVFNALLQVDIKNTISNDEIKNYVDSENLMVFGYLRMVMEKLNNNYVNIFLQYINLHDFQYGFKEVFDKIGVTELYKSEKYVNIMNDLKQKYISNNQDELYSYFIKFVALCIGDFCVSFYNFIYSRSFENERVKNIDKLEEGILKSHERINKLMENNQNMENNNDNNMSGYLSDENNLQPTINVDTTIINDNLFYDQ